MVSILRQTKIYIALSITIISTIIVIVILLLNKQNSSYEDPIKDCFNLINNQEDTSYLYSYYSSLPEEAKLSEMFFEYEDHYANQETGLFFEDILDIIDKFGYKYEITYKIIETSKLSSDVINEKQKYYNELVTTKDIEDVDNLYANAINITESEAKRLIKQTKKYYDKLQKTKVTEGYAVVIDITITGNNETFTFTTEVQVFKVNGNWLLDSAITPSDISFYIEDY